MLLEGVTDALEDTAAAEATKATEESARSFENIVFGVTVDYSVVVLGNAQVGFIYPRRGRLALATACGYRSPVEQSSAQSCKTWSCYSAEIGTPLAMMRTERTTLPRFVMET